MKLRYKPFVKFSIAIIICCLFSSCYSVRLKNVYGDPKPDPMNDSKDYYRFMDVQPIDTVITIKVTDKDFTMLIKDCGTAGIHTIEYRNTFGGVLLSAVTFGRKRRVRVKYVCMKPTN
ncbi:hypothetical protein IMCC3317_00150 [Kordia antarctica]|uniref:Lipoprotein n=1 Tax=Kordia antarctica TaxID=1218801 RepID=A0A7L4ZCI9_9FLAO|nr:hypothetical protein [Kordia antarctica]QHI34672.1 hypothetical protein IMCC3317_00150 [Kordia antarctica]